ncbi:MAG: hypothetical protein ACPGVU_13360 [Limisphaerales bacterium]
MLPPVLDTLLIPCHKDHDAMPQLGIFWVYQRQVFGRARALADGEESQPGLLDSPDDHVSLWEDPTMQMPVPVHLEYTDVPRGRVVFSTKDRRAIIYLDASLSDVAVRKRIRSFFDVTDIPVTWKEDPHYTTDARKLKAMLDREFGDVPPAT